MHTVRFVRSTRALRSLAAVAALTLLVAALTASADAGTSARRDSTERSSGAASPRTAFAERMTGAPPTGAVSVLRSPRRAARTDTTPAQRAIELGAVPCDDDPGALCGQFVVPLRRAHPDGRTTAIDFRLILHTDPGPAASTVWWNGGGPGPSTTRNELWLPGYLFGDLLATFDVLLTDVRGTGSNAPACPSLQEFSGYWPGTANHRPIADCAASIADRLDTYGAADSARDLNALRIALGIPKLDIIGNSYGAMTASAYATRFPQRTRSLIISSGVDVEATLRSKLSSEAHAIDRIVDLLCSRSAACSSGVPDASDALAAGVRFLHDHPLEGDAVSAEDADRVRHVVLTEGMLFSLLEESDGNWLSTAGEVPAAMIALGNGDPVPALRLAADATAMFDVEPYGVEPSVDSAGGYSASSCTDYRLPWRDGVPIESRIDVAAASVRRLDNRGEVGAWHAESIVRTPEYADWHQLVNCNRWPDVRAGRAVVDDVVYPNVPTLVMTSSLDPRTPLEDAERQAARWPRAQLLDIGGALHGAALWACGPDRVRAFLVTPGSVQAPCDPSDLPAFRAVGRFPVTSADATPLAVDPGAGDESTESDRRIAAVALDAVLDANSLSARQPFLGKGAGLRGGYAITSADDNGFYIELFEDRFAADVAVSGTLTFPFDGSLPTIDITVAADDGTTGHLSVIAEVGMGRPATAPPVVPVRGEMDGRPLALLMPL